MVRADLIPNNSPSINSLPNNIVAVWTGRINWVLLLPQRIGLGIGSLSSARCAIAAIKLLVSTPSTLALWTNHSPLSVAKRSACSTVMPLPRAQPSAALVGLPSASKAELTAGPRFSTTLSACARASSVMLIARRRGVAYQTAELNAKSALVSSSVKLAKNDSASLRNDLGGNSSVPNSMSKFSKFMFLPLLTHWEAKCFACLIIRFSDRFCHSSNA